MTEKQLFYPLLSVYFSLILGDLQKEKLQIVSIFRFGHKKRGLFQCPPAQLEWGKDGKSPYYAVNATLDFTDPLGAKHREQINVSVALCLGR